jgi:galactokinase/galacturonokinase
VRVVLAPYRICPLGAHLDHQQGPVLGTAIDAFTALAFAPAPGPELVLESGNFPGEVRLDLAAPAGPEPQDLPVWGRYALAAFRALRERLEPRPVGLVGRVEGSLPGAGLSSSSSVLLAYLTALAAVNDLPLRPEELVALSRRAENEHVGVQSGILDPASIVASRRGALVRIDTRASRWERVPVGAAAPPHCFLVAFTGQARSLLGTDFNRRVEECRAAAAGLARRAGLPPAHFLGELDDPVFAAHLEALPPAQQRRARHFVGERGRVLLGVECWRRGDLEAFGALMRESCRSSVENYETGSPELAGLQRILEGTPGIFGARFSGAGFGGCCVALVAEAEAEAARTRVLEAFRAERPELAARAKAFVARGEDGVRIA